MWEKSLRKTCLLPDRERLPAAGLREGCRPRGPPAGPPTARRPVPRWMPCAPYKEPAGPLPLALFASDPPRLIHNSHSFSPYKVWYRTDTRKHLTGPGLVSALIGRPFLLLAIELWPRGYSLLRRTWTPPLFFRSRSPQPVLWTQECLASQTKRAGSTANTWYIPISHFENFRSSEDSSPISLEVVF